MYNKEQLEQMEPIKLMEIALSMGIKVTPESEKEAVIYDILDKAAVDVAAGNLPEKPKRKYTRKAKTTEDAEPVASPTGETTEVTEKPKRKRKTKAEKEAEAAAQAVASQQPTPAEATEAAEAPEKPKRRGRKAKAAETEATEAPAVPEALESQDNTPADDAPDSQMLEQLQQKMEMHNQGVWEGDPGDGTNFIVVTDLPIEDNAAMPTLDIFDQPTTPTEETLPAASPTGTTGSTKLKGQSSYDFGDFITGNGVLEIVQDGYGFLRSSDYNYLSSPDDIYVSQQQVKKYSLKTGDVVECTVRPPHDGDKYFLLSTVMSINGRQPAEVRDRVSFEHLTPLFPEEKFNLTGDPRTTNPSTRIVDLFAPIGKGQRALIVAQPKTGKTILMKDIANAIAANHPEAYIMMLLIDERPEEVTDMSRTVNAEVIASTFDEPAERHVKIAGIVLEKAKRMVECGHDVVIFLDSITRLARAYNTVSPASGKVLTGGVDANALQKPKRFFGAARKIEGGGSLTIIATALVDTGSKMDEVIFEEFKGTGNSEIQLDRMLSNKRIFPSINLVQSSTRRDDLLQDQTTLNRMWIVRKFIAEMNPIEAMDTLRDRIMHSKSNEEFLISMNG
ncbi:MAG: transcription termination factor Rho [Prevotella sp.]|nr:transcription termination factor Rho [Prevotella sp.]